MPWVGFEPTIPASEWAKTVRVLDRPATVTGRKYLHYEKHETSSYKARVWSGLPMLLTQHQEHKVSYILLIAATAVPFDRESKINYI
jgi:hypothetical protein